MEQFPRRLLTVITEAVLERDGLAELFSNLGVQGIVGGGQTLNPSTAELLDAFETVGKMIAGTATREQLDELQAKSIPTAGSCAGQFTANTMAMVLTFLGLSPLQLNDIPAVPGMDEKDIQTPCLILDLDALERNIKKMGNYAKAHGMRHRVHGKMHKSVDVALLQERGAWRQTLCQRVPVWAVSCRDFILAASELLAAAPYALIRAGGESHAV